MTSSHIPFALPDIGEQEIDAAVACLRSGWLSTGPKTQQFETDFARFIGDETSAVAVNSATAGLHLALEAVGVGDGDEVITTPYTFTATAEVIRYLGAHPVFVDVEPGSLNIDPSAIAAAVTPRTKAIVPVHFAGLACRMEPIFEIARSFRLKVVEDAAHALPTLHHGKIIGAHASDATVFSFYATKTITTGEGGMIVTKHREIAERCRVMRLHGISRDVFDRYTSTKPKWQYEVIAPGFKYNMTDIAAAIGIEQLKKAHDFHRRRQEMAMRYSAAFAGLPLRLPEPAPAGDTHAWHLYVIRIGREAPIGRDAFVEAMAARGIVCSVHFIPLHLQPYWRDKYRLAPGDYPNALEAFSGAVSLPLFTRMTAAEQQRVIDAVRSILE